MGFSLGALAIAVCIGFFACKEDPKAASGWATYIVTVCEKSEKVHKFLSHILPVIIAIFKLFRYAVCSLCTVTLILA
jgi:hypothetical protein